MTGKWWQGREEEEEEEENMVLLMRGKGKSKFINPAVAPTFSFWNSSPVLPA